MTRKGKRKGSIPILLGLLLIAAALFLTLWNFRESVEAGKSAESVLSVIEHSMEEKETPKEQEAEDTPAETEIPDYILNPNMDMPTETVDGNEYLGIVSLPTLGIELPVMSEWSYPRLKIAPCRYAGSAYTDDLVILAHNYSTHFGRLKELQPGDRVVFQDVNGNTFTYEVASLETLNPTAVEEMTSGDWDLTLFTCTVGGKTRVTVRCTLISRK